jgi:hypothetical protein
MKEIKFSLFYDPIKGLFNSTPYKEIDLYELIAIYQSDWIEKVTARMQSEKDPKIQKDLKNKLPSFTPYGTFSPKRSNETIVYHNSNLIAFDVDEIGYKNAIDLREKLSSKDGCVMCTISPRKEGLKALFLISDTIPLKNKESSLDLNKSLLCEILDINEYFDNIDSSQFKRSQIFFIAFDPDGYFNPEPVPLKINLIIPEIKIQESIKIIPKKLNDESKKRIQIYLLKKTETLINQMKDLSKGQRHTNIWQVVKIKSNLHYLPEIETDIKGAFETMIRQMYDDETERIDSEIDWMLSWWEKAIDKKNDVIEQIIEDEK